MGWIAKVIPITGFRIDGTIEDVSEVHKVAMNLNKTVDWVVAEAVIIGLDVLSGRKDVVGFIGED